MLIHRKNWCRICGICLTCPRTKKSIFQQGDCHCPERQANHVPPRRVKGEKLFSFRYRHLSAEDIDILCELRPRFKFPTPPIERNLVRANICSTCQQRLRRARIFRRLNSSSKSKPDANNAVSDGSSDLNGDCSDRSGTTILRISNLIEAATLPQSPPHLLVSAMRSTLHRQVSQPCTSSQHSDNHSLWQHPMPASCSAADAVHCKLPAAQNEQPTDVESLEHNKKNDRHAAAAAHLWSLKSQTNLQMQNAAGSPSIGQRLGKQKDTCEQSDDDIDDLDTTHIDHDAYENSGLKPYPVVLPVYSEDRSRANRSGQIVYGCSSR